MLIEDNSCDFTKNNNHFLCSFPLNIYCKKIDNQTNTFLLFKGNFTKNNIDIEFKIKSSVIFDSINDKVFIKKIKIIDVNLYFDNKNTENITCFDKPNDIFDVNFIEYQNDFEGDIYQEIYKLLKKNTVVNTEKDKITLEMKIKSSSNEMNIQSLSISTYRKNLFNKKYKLLNCDNKFIQNIFDNVLLFKNFSNNFTIFLILILVNVIIISKKIPYKIINKLNIFTIF